MGENSYIQYILQVASFLDSPLALMKFLWGEVRAWEWGYAAGTIIRYINLATCLVAMDLVASSGTAVKLSPVSFFSWFSWNKVIE